MLSLVFDPENPYPLIDLSTVAYEDQKNHARLVDEWLGYEVEAVESRIERETWTREQIREQWIGLPPQSLQTPYVEIRRMLEEIKKLGVLREGATVTDIGAAYGRMGFVIHAHAPGVRFLGLELSADRVAEGSRVYLQHALVQARLDQVDAIERSLPEADVYFSYDFGSMKSIDILLEKLKIEARKRPITVVGRGRATRDRIERQHPWLTDIQKPLQFGNFSIYRTQ